MHIGTLNLCFILRRLIYLFVSLYFLFYNKYLIYKATAIGTATKCHFVRCKFQLVNYRFYREFVLVILCKRGIFGIISRVFNKISLNIPVESPGYGDFFNFGPKNPIFSFGAIILGC